MIFSRIRRHSPAAASRFAPAPWAWSDLAAAPAMHRDGLAFLLSGAAQHALAGSTHLPVPERDARRTPARAGMPGLPMVAVRHAVAQTRLRRAGPLAAKAAATVVVAGGFGALCLSYALACVTISNVLLGALA